MQDLLFALGLILFLLGLLTGMAIPALKNPRMGLAGHMVGMTNGPFLIVVGLLWPHVDLSHTWQVVTIVLLTYSSFANWLAMQLGALWGAGHKFAPTAAGDHRTSATKERIVDFLLVSLAPIIVAATVLLLIGVLRQS
jgi:hydroxylaminobenzene mutase